MNRILAMVNFPFPIPNKISTLSLLFSEKMIDLNHARTKEQKMQDENKNTAHHAERHNEIELVSQNLQKCVKKATPTGSTQLAKSIHATSDNIA